MRYLGSVGLYCLSRSLTAELRAGLRHGLTGLEAAAVPASKLDLPQLGEQTRLILGLAGEKSDTEDSAYEDPNTESLKAPCQYRYSLLADKGFYC